MKTIVFADVHGMNLWKKVLAFEKKYDKVVFLGDYFDPYYMVYVSKMYENFDEILKLKKKMKDKCILLIGNHDYHYIYDSPGTTRYNRKTQELYGSKLSKLYTDGTMVFAHRQDNILFTHAGVSKYWLEEIAGLSEDSFTPADLNKLDLGLYNFNLYTDIFDTYGNSKSQSPIWIRPNALLDNSITRFTQIVGHTRMRTIINNDNIWFTDAGEFDNYLVIEDGNIIPKTLKREKKNVQNITK